MVRFRFVIFFKPEQTGFADIFEKRQVADRVSGSPVHVTMCHRSQPNLVKRRERARYSCLFVTRLHIHGSHSTPRFRGAVLVGGVLRVRKW